MIKDIGEYHTQEDGNVDHDSYNRVPTVEEEDSHENEAVEGDMLQYFPDIEDIIPADESHESS